MFNSSKPVAEHGKNYVATAVASFVGIMAAVPIGFALFNPDVNRVGATTDQPATSITADAAYAQYAHAYTQGYLASVHGGGATASVDDNSCREAASSAQVGGQGATATSTTHSTTAHATVNGGYGQHNGGGQGSVDWNDDDDNGNHVMTPREWREHVSKSYNSYSTTHNSSHSEVNNSYTNSNNVVGSHNSTETNVEVKDSKNVDITTENETSGSNVAVSDSFNKDSYNTETNTTVVNDSFNETTTENTVVVDDSYNTETNNSVKVEDSYNHEVKHETETNNTTIVNESFNNEETTTTIENSGNETRNNGRQGDSGPNARSEES